MLTVAATDLKNKLGQIMDQARREPLLVQSHGRDMVVILDHAEFARLQQVDKAFQAAFVHSGAAQNLHQVALAAIQGGKYRRLQNEGDVLPSDAYAHRKAEDKLLEERKWNST